jgi:hypothetical protein
MPIAQCSIEIAAPVEVVWGVMLDLARYGEWNPFIVRIDAPPKVEIGSRLLLHVKWADGGGATPGECITRLEPPSVLEYRFTGPLATFGLVKAGRVQTLTPVGSGHTRYDSREEFRGLLGAFIPLKKVQAGFDQHARALKQRAESLARSS